MITTPASDKRWKSDLSKCRLSQPSSTADHCGEAVGLDFRATFPFFQSNFAYFSFLSIEFRLGSSFFSIEFRLESPFTEAVSGCLFDKGWLCPLTDNLRSILHTGDDSTSLVLLLTPPLISCFPKDCNDFLI